MAHHFENTMVVLPEHLDDLNHVNNVMYVQFMQDIAMQHWYSISSPALNDEIMWVVRRHEIDYHFPAVLNDTLLLKTHTGAHSCGLTCRQQDPRYPQSCKPRQHSSCCKIRIRVSCIGI